MSGKNTKHGQPKPPAGSQRCRWTALLGHGPDYHREEVPESSYVRDEWGQYVFRDDAGVVAEFPAGCVAALLRAAPQEPVQVTLPARFVTTSASVRELQGALGAALGMQVVLLPPGSKATDAVSEPE